MSIVCATNFSEEAMEAANVATALAAHRQEPIRLLHVIPLRTMRSYGTPIRDAATERLKTEAKRLEKSGARIETVIREGRIDEEIKSYLSETKAHLLVVGDTAVDRGQVREGLLERVAYQSPVPTLVVREPKVFLAWANKERPLRVTLGVDRTTTSRHAAEFVNSLSEFGKIEVNVYHAYWAHDECRRLGLRVPGPLENVPQELAPMLERELLDSVLRFSSHVSMKLNMEIQRDRIAEHILDYAVEGHADLLVMGTHHKRALAKLGSVSNEVVREAPMSVAMVPQALQQTKRTHDAAPEFSTVLALTDMSHEQDSALVHGLSLLPRGGALHLVTWAKSSATDGECAAIREALRGRIPKKLRRDDVSYETHVIRQDASRLQSVMQIAERYEANAICIAANDASLTPSNFATDGWAVDLLRRSQRPVLVVRDLAN